MRRCGQDPLVALSIAQDGEFCHSRPCYDGIGCVVKQAKKNDADAYIIIIVSVFDSSCGEMES